MPGGRDECPVEVRIDDVRHDAAFLEFNKHCNDTERAINTYCRIRPTEGDQFGLYVALYPDFDFSGYTHLKVSLFVDGWYVRTQYLEARYDERFLNVKKGRKVDRTTDQTVEFSCLVGDVDNPGDHELDGTISVELSLGHKVFRRPRIPKANLVEETNTFRYFDYWHSLLPQTDHTAATVPASQSLPHSPPSGCSSLHPENILFLSDGTFYTPKRV